MSKLGQHHVTTPGPRNLISDISGIRVGHGTCLSSRSGVTVIRLDHAMTAAVDVRGGAPGTRETDVLAPGNLVETIDALVFSGGSALGLDAAGAVQRRLVEAGRGFPVGDQRVPIVPQAILFDLLNGGDKSWPDGPPYPGLAEIAYDTASDDAPLGSVGAGLGATTATLRGGVGSASSATAGGIVVAALAVVNALGSVTVPGTPHFWAASFEEGDEFGGLGPAPARSGDAVQTKIAAPEANTTLAVVATNLALTRTELSRLAVSAHDGFARAIVPAHTPFDGDIVFAISSGERAMDVEPADLMQISHMASIVTSRAIARGVYLVGEIEGWDSPPTYHRAYR